MSKRQKPASPRKARVSKDEGGAVRRKLIAFEPEIFEALTLLARDRMQSFQELADEAFGDVLRKHGRPTTLKEALRASTRSRS